MDKARISRIHVVGKGLPYLSRRLSMSTFICKVLDRRDNRE